MYESVYELPSSDQKPPGQIIGDSLGLRRVLRYAEQYARSSAPVMITGESGTGKEGIARRIHELSERKDQAYARINCAALSEGLLESELFGHERGAFTGAISQRIGRFEWAAGGTLLLDEISEIPLALQAKLLRVLEENEFQRVGANQTQIADVRILATSNRVLEQEVHRGNFRRDLFHRISVLPLQMPPLRERQEDIPELVLHFLQLFRDEREQPVTRVIGQAMKQLVEYSWPGNIRELRNVVHRSVVLAKTTVLSMEDIPRLTDESAVIDSESGVDLLDLPLEEAERRIILMAIERFQGNKSAASRHLGITARTLHNKLNRYRDAA
jgi:transcriptional regulator with PAS, ATPase and Fis domain